MDRWQSTALARHPAHSRVLALIEKHRGTVPTRSEPSRPDTRTPSMADARSREFRLSQVLDKVRPPATHSQLRKTASRDVGMLVVREAE